MQLSAANLRLCKQSGMHQNIIQRPKTIDDKRYANDRKLHYILLSIEYMFTG